MKLLLDFLPIVLFFVTFKWAGANPEHAQSTLSSLLGPLATGGLPTAQLPILAATVVAIAATFLQIVYQKATGKKVENMQWVGLALIVVFGGATLILQDETFIKWKPSILYWAMGTGFIIAKLFGKNPIQAMMKGQVEMPEFAWNTLLYSWVAFFALMGSLNLFVAYSFSTDIWVDFKLFGSLGATLIFIFAQGFYMSRHIKPDAQSK